MGVQPGVSLDGLIDFSLAYVKLQEILAGLLEKSQEQEQAIEAIRADGTVKYSELSERLESKSEELKAAGAALQASVDEKLESKFRTFQTELDQVKADLSALDFSNLDRTMQERIEARCAPLEEILKELNAARVEDAKKLEEERQKASAGLAELKQELSSKFDHLGGDVANLAKEVQHLSSSQQKFEGLASDQTSMLDRLKALEERLEKTAEQAAAAVAAAAAAEANSAAAPAAAPAAAAAAAAGTAGAAGDSHSARSGGQNGQPSGHTHVHGDKVAFGGGECGPEATGSSTSTTSPSSIPGSAGVGSVAGSLPAVSIERPNSGAARPSTSALPAASSSVSFEDSATARRPQTAEVSRRSISEGGRCGTLKEDDQAEIQDLRNSVDEVQTDAKRLAKELEVLAATVSGDCDSLAQFRAAHAMEVRRLEEGVRAARSDATGKSVAEKLSKDLSLLNRRIDSLAGQLEVFSQRGSAAVSQCICCSTKMPAQENKILIGTDGKTYFRGGGGRMLDIGRVAGAGPSNLFVPSRHGSAGQQSKRGLLPKVPGMPHSASAGAL